ncbi:unnamed protein product [Symbiodinium microadriaticum]|nr:unnamed protein product [Symbiodinium microadriaticum]
MRRPYLLCHSQGQGRSLRRAYLLRQSQGQGRSGSGGRVGVGRFGEVEVEVEDEAVPAYSKNQLFGVVQSRWWNAPTRERCLLSLLTALCMARQNALAQSPSRSTNLHWRSHSED